MKSLLEARGDSLHAPGDPCVIVPRMFDVLVYLYENYWRPDACPDHEQLTRKLSSVGFESDEITDALSWLDGLANALGPRPETDPQAAWWTRRTNLENFLNALASATAGSAQPILSAFTADIRKLQAGLP